MRPYSSPRLDPSENGLARLWRPAPTTRPNYHTHVLLFVMTVVTTVVAGMVMEGLNPLAHPGEFYRGLPYAGTLLAILLAHEMGHYLTARYYGMDVTLPYFIPAPPPLFFLGTLGAFIRMRSPARHRRALLQVGAAGPLAGFCVALPAVIYAYATATVVPIHGTAAGIYFGEPLLLQAIGRLLVGPVPEGYALHINSVGVAGWFGLLVTMLNLLPIGQLDGGHILYALLGRYARYVSRAVIAALLVLGFLFPGWFFWAFFGWLTSLRHPLILDPYLPLDRRSLSMAAAALAIFVLCFMPVPITIGSLG
ncbi:MAG: metalloprotease [Candidatus Tectimicrobiota bacterium]|nr:MAG: metalloprotease [Candidatus Tectomicrobia bacterium]